MCACFVQVEMEVWRPAAFLGSLEVGGQTDLWELEGAGVW